MDGALGESRGDRGGAPIGWWVLGKSHRGDVERHGVRGLRQGAAIPGSKSFQLRGLAAENPGASHEGAWLEVGLVGGDLVKGGEDRSQIRITRRIFQIAQGIF